MSGDGRDLDLSAWAKESAVLMHDLSTHLVMTVVRLESVLDPSEELIEKAAQTIDVAMTGDNSRWETAPDWWRHNRRIVARAVFAMLREEL